MQPPLEALLEELGPHLERHAPPAPKDVTRLLLALDPLYFELMYTGLTEAAGAAPLLAHEGRDAAEMQESREGGAASAANAAAAAGTAAGTAVKAKASAASGLAPADAPPRQSALKEGRAELVRSHAHVCMYTLCNVHICAHAHAHVVHAHVRRCARRAPSSHDRIPPSGASSKCTASPR